MKCLPDAKNDCNLASLIQPKGGRQMFKHLFQSMNETLNHILESYPTSTEHEKQTLYEQLRMLRAISDDMIEEWLLFEEKMAKTKDLSMMGSPVCPLPAEAASDAFDWSGAEKPARSLPYQKGEGYFKLTMFNEAAAEFEKAIASFPEFLPARLYLALCLLQMGQFADACKHLQMLISLADNRVLKAVAYNALGCVKALQGEVEKACECFHTSYQLDPDFKDPVYNLKACQMDGGVLQLGVAIG